jgi:hypothetical protein
LPELGDFVISANARVVIKWLVLESPLSFVRSELSRGGGKASGKIWLGVHGILILGILENDVRMIFSNSLFIGREMYGFGEGVILPVGLVLILLSSSRSEVEVLLIALIGMAGERERIGFKR